MELCVCLSCMTTVAPYFCMYNLERVGIQQVDFGWRLGRYLSSLTGSARQAALALAKQ